MPNKFKIEDLTSFLINIFAKLDLKIEFENNITSGFKIIQHFKYAQ